MKLSRNSQAFTLVEILMTIAIIGILASVAIVNLNNARGKARSATAKSWGSSMGPVFVLCSDSNGLINDWGDGTAVCSPSTGETWPRRPNSYETIQINDNTTADGTWEIEIMDDDEAYNCIRCTQENCINTGNTDCS